MKTILAGGQTTGILNTTNTPDKNYKLQVGSEINCKVVVAANGFYTVTHATQNINESLGFVVEVFTGELLVETIKVDLISNEDPKTDKIFTANNVKQGGGYSIKKLWIVGPIFLFVAGVILIVKALK